MSNASKTECGICYESIAYGARVESMEVWDAGSGWVYAIVHSGCAVTYEAPDDSYDDWDGE